MARLIIDFESNNAVVGGVCQPRITVFVLHKALHISFLCTHTLLSVVHATFLIIIGISACRLVTFRVAIAKVGLCGKNHADSTLLQAEYKIVEQVEMLILYEITLSIGYFHVPDVYAVGIQSESGNVIHITVDGIFRLYPKLLHSAIGMGKRQRIVHAIECHLLAARSIAHHSLLIHIYARSLIDTIHSLAL